MTLQPNAEAARDKVELKVASAASYSHQPSLVEAAPSIEQNLSKLLVREQQPQIELLRTCATSGSVGVYVPKISVTPTRDNEVYEAASKEGYAHAKNVAHCENFQYRKTAKVSHIFFHVMSKVIDFYRCSKCTYTHK